MARPKASRKNSNSSKTFSAEFGSTVYSRSTNPRKLWFETNTSHALCSTESRSLITHRSFVLFVISKVVWASPFSKLATISDISISLSKDNEYSNITANTTARAYQVLAEAFFFRRLLPITATRLVFSAAFSLSACGTGSGALYGFTVPSILSSSKVASIFD